jgi:diguanylate cyclase (GGDEF)-like protein/PAS domain S-box-containing protein
VTVPTWLAGSPSSLLLFAGAEVVGASVAACRELGSSRADLVGPGFAEAVLPDDRIELEASLLGSPRDPSGEPLLLRRRRPDRYDPTGPTVRVLELRFAPSGEQVLAAVRDVTEAHRMDRMMGVLFMNVRIVDAAAGILWRLSTHLRRPGQAADEEPEVNALSLIHPDDLVDVLDHFGEVVASPGVPNIGTFRAHIEDDRTIWGTVRVIAVNQMADPLIDGIVVGTEVNPVLASIGSISRTGTGFRSLAAGAPIGIVVADLTGRSLYCNDLAESLLGVGQTLDGRSEWTGNMRPADRAVVDRVMGEARERRTGGSAVVAIDRPDGSEVWVRVDVLPQVNDVGEPFGLMATLIDVTSENLARRDLQATQAQLWQLANHDVLTGLPNRMQFDDQLARAVVRTDRSGQGLAVLFCDVDEFKPVNDTHGHHVGDVVLVEVARRLTSTSRDSDTVFRIGGDEFVVVCEGFDDPAGLELLADRLVRSVGRPITVGGVTIEVGLSIGIAVATPGTSVGTVLARADAALYRAKGAGRNRSVIVGDGR